MYPALSIGSCCFTLISCRIHLRRQSSRLLDITFFTGQEKRAPTQPGAQAHRHGAVVTPAGCPAPAERRALTSGKPNPVQMPCSSVVFFTSAQLSLYTFFFNKRQSSVSSSLPRGAASAVDHQGLLLPRPSRAANPGRENQPTILHFRLLFFHTLLGVFKNALYI